MAQWYSIEVSNGPGGSARTWVEAYGDIIIGVALGHGASGWAWTHRDWGSVLDLEVPDEATWEAFMAVEAVRAALEAVPDPVEGLLIRPGRGGSAGSRQPGRPRPLTGSGSAAVPLPTEPDDDVAQAVSQPTPTVAAPIPG